jgi:putative hemolysin
VQRVSTTLDTNASGARWLLVQRDALGRRRAVGRTLTKAVATTALLLLAACDPFQPDNVQAVIVTPESQCANAGGIPATHKAKDGTPWKVCTFDDTRVCDLAKLRTDNRCYTTVPDSTSGN